MASSLGCRVRRAEAGDVDVLVALRAALWPEGAREEHAAAVRGILAGTPPSTMPLVVMVAELGGAVVGFAEVGLRSHADGCDPRRPVGYLEGWYVAPPHRGRGIGRALLRAAEHWCRDLGCSELASDTWIDDAASQRAHEAFGFEVVDRCVNYRKDLRP
jgi:aminoglycoside 6'-N-acetyltransferase I